MIILDKPVSGIVLNVAGAEVYNTVNVMLFVTNIIMSAQPGVFE